MGCSPGESQAGSRDSGLRLGGKEIRNQVNRSGAESNEALQRGSRAGKQD